jgi:hypothetical protein
MPERTHCINCEEFTAVYKNGVYQCERSECQSIYWGPFDKPHAGRRRKGETCFHCEGSTLHPVAQISNVEVWRCSVCGATHLYAKRV